MVIWWGFLASLAAGLATFVGTLPLLVFRRPSERVLNTMLGFAAGVMLAATAFSLVVPALEAGGAPALIVGMLLGGAFVHQADRWIPHEHFGPLGREGAEATKLRRVWLFVFAITIHNFPEGLAVGVGYGSGDMAAGTTLAIAIGLQNMPEGLAVGAPLVRLGYSLRYALFISLLTGLVEPIGGLIGAGLVTLARPLLGYMMGFAAGAMLWVISAEIIPETHETRKAHSATYGVIAGFLVMALMDNLLEKMLRGA
ncbi:MAG: ZIP family metal transporter [Planctomycetes bacterium]|nr:ZIP family metal transporter [Planctomycetota bacterium]